MRRKGQPLVSGGQKACCCMDHQAAARHLWLAQWQQSLMLRCMRYLQQVYLVPTQVLLTDSISYYIPWSITGCLCSCHCISCIFCVHTPVYMQACIQNMKSAIWLDPGICALVQNLDLTCSQSLPNVCSAEAMWHVGHSPPLNTQFCNASLNPSTDDPVGWGLSLFESPIESTLIESTLIESTLPE